MLGQPTTDPIEQLYRSAMAESDAAPAGGASDGAISALYDAAIKDDQAGGAAGADPISALYQGALEAEGHFEPNYGRDLGTALGRGTVRLAESLVTAPEAAATALASPYAAAGAVLKGHNFSGRVARGMGLADENAGGLALAEQTLGQGTQLPLRTPIGMQPAAAPAPVIDQNTGRNVNPGIIEQPPLNPSAIDAVNTAMRKTLAQQAQSPAHAWMFPPAASAPGDVALQRRMTAGRLTGENDAQARVGDMLISSAKGYATAIRDIPAIQDVHRLADMATDSRMLRQSADSKARSGTIAGLPEAVAENAPQVLAQLGLAYLTGGGSVVGRAGAFALGAAPMELAGSFDENVQKLTEQGMDEGEARLRSAPVAAAVAAVNTFLERASGRGFFADDAVKKTLARRTWEGMKRGLASEAPTETAQEVVSATGEVASGADPSALAPGKIIPRAGLAGAVGGILGAGAGALAGAAGGEKKRPLDRAQAEAVVGEVIDKARAGEQRAPSVSEHLYQETSDEPDVRSVRDVHAPGPATDVPPDDQAGREAGVQEEGQGQVPPQGQEEELLSQPAHEFSSTQLNLSGEPAADIRALAAEIPDEDLAPDGREENPHVTVKFGLHTDDPAEVARLLQGQGPITVTMGKTSLFENDEHDVVKVDVEGPELRALNGKLKTELENTETHPEYQPHATIAYVKPGLGKQYAGRGDLEGQSITIDRLVFSDKNRRQHSIMLDGSGTIAPALPEVQSSAASAQSRPPTTSTSSVSAGARSATAGFPAPSPSARPAGQSATAPSASSRISTGASPNLSSSRGPSPPDSVGAAAAPLVGLTGSGRGGEVARGGVAQGYRPVDTGGAVDGLEAMDNRALVRLAAQHGVDAAASRNEVIARLRRKGVKADAPAAQPAVGGQPGAAQKTGAPGQGTGQAVSPSGARDAQGSAHALNSTRAPQVRQRFDAKGAGHQRLSKQIDALVSDGTMSGPTADLVLELLTETEDAYLGRLNIEAAQLRDTEGIKRAGAASDAATGRKPRKASTEFARIEVLKGLEGRLKKLGRLESELDMHPAAVVLEEFFHLAEELVLNDTQKRVLRREYASKTRQEWEKVFLEGIANGNQEAAQYAASSYAEWVAHMGIQHALGIDAPTSRLRAILDDVLAAFLKVLRRLADTAGGVPTQLRPLFQAMLRGDVQAEPESRPKPARRPSPPAPLAKPKEQQADLTEAAAGGKTASGAPETPSDTENVPRRGTSETGNKPENAEVRSVRSSPGLPSERPEAVKREKTVRPDPEPMTKVAEGRKGTLELPDGRALEVTYRLVEAGELTPSHDARNFFRKNAAGDENERPYEDRIEGGPSRDTVTRMAENPRPALLTTDTPTAIDGPPIIDPAGRVLGGNARSMAVQLAYDQVPSSAKKLREAMLEAAPRFGIKAEDAAAFKQPMIVRALSQDDAGDPGEMSRILNQAMTTGRTSTADAVSRAKKIDAATASLITAAIEDRTLGEALGNDTVAMKIVRAMQESGAWSKADAAAYVEGGSLNKEGKSVIERTLLGSIIPDVAAMAEASPSVRNLLIRAAGPMIRLRKAMGKEDSDVDFEKMISGSMEVIAKRKAGNFQSVDELMAESLAPEGALKDPRAVALARAIENMTPTAFAEHMQKVADAVVEAQSGQVSMTLGRAPSAGEAFDSAMIGDVGGLFARGLYGEEDFDPEDIPLLELTRVRHKDGSDGWQMVDSRTGQAVSRIYRDWGIAKRETQQANQARRDAAREKARAIKQQREGTGYSDAPRKPGESDEEFRLRRKWREAERDTGKLFGRALPPDSPEFKAWFGDSKVVDENGKPKVVYHGARRPDRIGSRFLKSRATSGPSAFFTTDPQIASGYSTNKADTSLDAPMYEGWFKFTPKGSRKPVDIDRAWWMLSQEERLKVARQLPHVTSYDEGNNETGKIRMGGPDEFGVGGRDHWLHEVRHYRGNVLKAGVEIWLASGHLFDQEQQFMDVLRLGGMPMDRVEYDDPNAERAGVYPVYLSIQKPLTTTQMPTEVVEALDRRSRRQRPSKRGGADSWDKRVQDAGEWMHRLRDGIEKDETMVWTSIPDWVTDTLKGLGYDGIHDLGGKGGGMAHEVWIPFEPAQIKSAFNRGTFSARSPNINYGRALEDANQDELGFFSRTRRWVKEKMRGPMDAEQLRKAVFNAQLPSDEIRWTGLGEWLESRTGRVTPAQVLEWLDQNQVVLREVTKGNKSGSDPRVAELTSEIDQDRLTVRRLAEKHITGTDAAETIENLVMRADGGRDVETVNIFSTVVNGLQPFGDTGEDNDRIMSALKSDDHLRETWTRLRRNVIRRSTIIAEHGFRGGDMAQYEQYTLPGGSNYREVLLTLPPESKDAPWEKRGKTWVKRGQAKPLIEELPNGKYRLDMGSGIHGTHDTLDEAKSAALASPLDKSPDVFRSGHFAEPNIIAHFRLMDRTTPDGRRVLFVEEMQSDWHQAGRDRGYVGSETKLPEGFKVVEGTGRYGDNFLVVDGDGQQYETKRSGYARGGTREEAVRMVLDDINKVGFGVPRAPWSKTWHEMAFRRAVRLAAQGDYDAIGWTTGEQQVDRYEGIARDVVVGWTRLPDGDYAVTVNGPRGGDVDGWHGGRPKRMKLDEVSATFGKEMARNMQAEPKGESPFKMGGEGMRSFYDRDLPSYAAKMGKRWGVQPGQAEIGAADNDTPIYKDGGINKGIESIHILPINQEMRESVMREGQPLFGRGLFDPDDQKPTGETQERMFGDQPGEQVKGARPGASQRGPVRSGATESGRFELATGTSQGQLAPQPQPTVPAAAPTPRAEESEEQDESDESAPAAGARRRVVIKWDDDQATFVAIDPQTEDIVDTGNDADVLALELHNQGEIVEFGPDVEPKMAHPASDDAYIQGGNDAMDGKPASPPEGEYRQDYVDGYDDNKDDVEIPEQLDDPDALWFAAQVERRALERAFTAAQHAYFSLRARGSKSSNERLARLKAAYEKAERDYDDKAAEIDRVFPKKKGDTVEWRQNAGTTVTGVVVSLGDRNAEVRLADGTHTVGTEELRPINNTAPKASPATDFSTAVRELQDRYDETYPAGDTVRKLAKGASTDSLMAFYKWARSQHSDVERFLGQPAANELRARGVFPKTMAEIEKAADVATQPRTVDRYSGQKVKQAVPAPAKADVPEAPKAVAGQQMGLLGDRYAGGITGSQRALFSTERGVASPASQEAQQVQQERTGEAERDKETGRLFARRIPDDDLPDAETAPEPSRAELEFIQQSAADSDTPQPKDGASLQRLADALTRPARGASHLFDIAVRTATGMVERLGPGGKQLAGQIRDVVGRADERAGTAIDDAQQALKGLTHAERVLAMKWLNGRRPPIGVPDRIKRVADQIRDILDRDMNDARAAGVTRRLRSGKRVPLRGSGKAFPQVVTAAGQDFLRRARATNGSDPEVVAWADDQVAKGNARSAGEAVARLLAWEDAKLRGVHPYFELTRVELPEKYIEWDPAKVLPPHLHRSGMFVEGAREWGSQFEQAWELVGKIRAEKGSGYAKLVGDYFRGHFGGGSRQITVISKGFGAVSNLQTLMKLGLSPLSALQNIGQRFSGTIRHEPQVLFASMSQYPPLVNGFIRRAVKLERAARRAGAVSTVSELTTPEGGAPLAQVTQLVMAPFQSVEAGNQTTAAVMGAIGLQRDVDRLMRSGGPQTRFGKVLETALAFSGMRDPRAAVVRRVHRAGITPERLIDLLSRGKPLTPGEVRAAMRALTTQTQFPLNMATEPIWWRAGWYSPALRLATKFKHWGLRQTALIARDVIGEALRGNPGPMIRFIVAMILTGELYALARDIIYGDDKSITSGLFNGKKEDAQQWARRVMSSFSKGGGVGLLVDLTYGVSNFVAGPAASTLQNLFDFANQAAVQPAKGAPFLPGAAASELLMRELPALRQAAGALDIAERQFNENAQRAKDYRDARKLAAAYRAGKREPDVIARAAGLAESTMYGPEDFRSGPYSLALRTAGRLIDAGDVVGATSYIRAALESGKAAESRGDALKTIRTTLFKHSPLSAVSDRDMRAFLDTLEKPKTTQVLQLEREWQRSAAAALRAAVDQTKPSRE